MRTSFITTIIMLLPCAVVHAEATKQARTTIVIEPPLLGIDLGIKGGHLSTAVYGIGLNHRTSTGLYASAHAGKLFNRSGWGEYGDATLGYSINLNSNRHAPWLVDIVPQGGYRYAERVLFYRNGVGPRNVTHGMLVGLSYDIYQNQGAGFFLRAHTLLEWAPFSVISPKFEYKSGNSALTYGLDLGLSFGISFGH